MNEDKERPLASLPTEVLQETYRRAKQGDSEEDERAARVISRELIHRKMQPTHAPTIPVDDDLDDVPLGKACSIDNPDCTSCE